MSRFRPDIEGLRAVAVLAVVLFHAGVPGAGGGYVGVDVFFVISGFLITGLLRREIQDTGTVRLARFYGARARRLLPAATVVLVATVAGSAWLLPPLQARAVLGDAVAGALYAVNYRLAVQGTDYLAADAPPSPFQHYWSLGAEEQFYLLWPALLLLAVAVGRRRGAPARWPTPVVLTAVTVASLVVSLLWTRTSPPWAYFSLPSRAWELGVGGLLAVSAPVWRRLGGAAAAVATWTGLALVVVAVVVLGPSTPFPGTAALLPAAGAALVIGAGCAGSRAGAAVLLSTPPFRAVGRWSYSWYLWHWPVLLLAPHLLGRPLGFSARLVAAAASLVLAVATVRLVENPIRFAGRLRRSPGRSVALGLGLAGAGVAAALVATVVVPAPVGSGAAAPPPRISRQAAEPTDPGSSPGDEQVQRLTGQVAATVAASDERQPVPSNLTPSLQGAADDSQVPFQQGCVLSWTAATVRDCVYGDPNGQSTVALIGDSHAAQWFPALEPLAEQRHERLDVQSKVTCPPMDLPITSPYLGREYTECQQWRAQVLDRMRTELPSLVVVAMAHRYGADFGFTSYDPQWLAALTRLVGDLRATGARVLVLGPVPDPHGNVPTCLSEHLDSVGACSPARDAGIDAAGVAAEERAVRAGGGDYADLTELFCTASACPVVVGNDLVFRDDNHLTPEYAALLAPVLQAIVDRATAVR